MMAAAEPCISVDPSGPDRLDRRRLALMDAARTLFLEKGYEQTTLADIVHLAGGSLATVYKLFGNKEGLLIAVVRGQAESGADIVSQVSSLGLPPVATLRTIGNRLHERFVHPDAMALLRVVITRSVADPQFAREFYESTMGESNRELERLFARWQADGLIRKGAPGDLAEAYMALMIYDFQIAAISHCPRGSLDPERLSGRVRLFCRGIGLGE